MPWGIYVEDVAPPFWDSLAMLQRHFVLERVREELPLFRVTAPPIPRDATDLPPCPILRPPA
jgi:hypothetical protein